MPVESLTVKCNGLVCPIICAPTLAVRAFAALTRLIEQKKLESSMSITSVSSTRRPLPSAASSRSTAESSTSFRPDDMFEEPRIVNGLWSQRRKPQADAATATKAKSRRSSSSTQESPAAPDMALVFNEEAKALETVIAMLETKLSRALTALDNSKAAKSKLEQQMQASAAESAEAKRLTADLEASVASRDFTIALLQQQCAQCEAEIIGLQNALSLRESESPAVLAQLAEATRRAEAAERILSSERSIIKRYLQQQRQQQGSTVALPKTADLTAAILVDEMAQLGNVLSEQAAALQTAAQQVQELEEGLETERQWREDAQAAATSAEERSDAARARARVLILQLERQKVEAAAVQCKLKETQTALQEREKDAEERKEAARRHRHGQTTDKMVYSRAKAEKIEVCFFKLLTMLY
jgi:chromosome segregation ATPase